MGRQLTFATLKRLGETNPHAQRTFDLLMSLDSRTPDSRVDLLVSELRSIGFHSNTNTVFEFYFPLVAHILYYKPKREKDLLSYIVGPSFANGITEAKESMAFMKRAMDYQLSLNEHFLTPEGQKWVNKQLPKMRAEFKREVQLCLKELED